MQKFETYQNQQSFVPTFNNTQDSSKLPRQYAVLLTEADLTSAPANLQTVLTNQVLVSDVKKASTVVYGTEGAAFDRVLILYSKTTEAKGAFKSARAHLKKITEVFRGDNTVSLQVSNSFNQEFLNEYVYGLFSENYQWQLKSQTGDEENKSIFKPVKNFEFFSTNLNLQDEQFQYISQVVKYQLYAKELMNTRANIATTSWMANQAQILQQNNSSNVDIEIIRGDQLLEKGLNLMHAVGRASSSDPILVILNYRGDPTNAAQKTALVGKGVVYDCGGLSLKQALTEIMHADKGGACSVLSAFRGIVELGLKVNVVCTLGLVENMISGNSYRNSDIITTFKGLNVEVLNTDAEGRNVLADALAYTQLNYKPQRVFDCATLTGACLVALGNDTAAVFSNKEELSDEIVQISRKAYEPVHPLPITEWMRENIVSDQGDIRNLGKAPWGGSGTAAAFLEKFIEKDVEWAHFDIAQACGTKGELLMVRTIIDFMRRRV